MISNTFQIFTLITITIFLFLFTYEIELFLNFVIIPIARTLSFSDEMTKKLVDFFFKDSVILYNNQISNLIIYIFCVCLISFCVFCFSNYKKNGVLLLFFSIILYPVANLFMEIIWIRRNIFFILMIPVIPRIWAILLGSVSAIGGGYYYQKILKGICVISLSIFVIPGFYLPPFFDGISGWYNYHKYDKINSYKDIGLRIKFTNNSTVWVRPSFFNPMTQMQRPYRIIKWRDEKFYKSDEFYNFLLSIYIKSYPSLKEKRLPTQKILGRFSYSTHTFDKFDIRERYLPPSEVIAFELIEITNDNGNRSEIILEYWNLNG